MKSDYSNESRYQTCVWINNSYFSEQIKSKLVIILVENCEKWTPWLNSEYLGKQKYHILAYNDNFVFLDQIFP